MRKEKRTEALTNVRKAKEKKAVWRALRVNPEKLNQVSALIRGKKIAPEFLTPSIPGRIVRGDVPQAARAQARKLAKGYEKAGYGIIGTTHDGVVVVKPSGQPDSFSLEQLDKAFSEVQAKN